METSLTRWDEDCFHVVPTLMTLRDLSTTQ